MFIGKTIALGGRCRVVCHHNILIVICHVNIYGGKAVVIFCIFPACGKSRNDHYRRNGKLDAWERPVNAISLYSSALANSEAYYSHCIYQYKGSQPLFNKECLKKVKVRKQLCDSAFIYFM